MGAAGSGLRRGGSCIGVRAVRRSGVLLLDDPRVTGWEVEPFRGRGWRLFGVAVFVMVSMMTIGAWGARPPAVFVAMPEDAGPGEKAVPVKVVADRVVVRFRGQGVQLAGGPMGAFPGGIRWIAPRSGAALAGAGVADTALRQLAVVTLPPGLDLRSGIAALGRRPEVLYAEPDLQLRIAQGQAGPRVDVPNDFEFGRQWSLRNTGQTGGRAGADIGALGAWQFSTGSSSVVVAIVDTGVDFFHPDLEANLWTNPREIPGNGIDDDGNGYVDDVHGYDFVSDDADPMDDNVHGTHVAGILGAVGNDENGIAGVAWSVGMMALKAFDETGSGTLDDTLSAIAYARAAGARVINASWGTTTRSRALDELVAESIQSGIVFVAAAGNNGTDARFFPAAVPDAIAVGATDANDVSPTFSNYGSFVDLVAPGDAIESTIPNASWAVLSGTSMAAPHVSGVVALMLARRPGFTPSEIATILRSTADEVVTDRYTGAGRLNAARALSIEEPLPQTRLDVPSTLSGVLDLRGLARSNRFEGYRLEMGLGQRPAVWIPVVESRDPDVGGVLLAGFDTARFDDGDYTLRLVVSNTLGQVAMERAPVAVRNVQLTAPANDDVLRQGDVIELRGTVFGEGRVFELDWGVGKSPILWETQGIVVVGGGAGQVVDGLLGTWDTSKVPSGSFVVLRVRARSGGRLVGESFSRMVHVESRLRAGWPRRLPFTDDFPLGSWREFNVADLDGDGVKEVVLVDHGEPGGRPPRLLAIEPDGQLKWSRDLPEGAPEYDAPVIGDLDGDGRLEVLVDTGDGGTISAFDADGRPLGGGWPVKPGGTHFGKILADIDHDGRLELVALSRPPPDLEGGLRRPLVVINARGEVVRRWLVSACDVDALVPEQLPAVAQLDGDDDLEIVAVDGCGGVSAFKLSKADGPLWTAATDANLFASPVVADLDGDGREEVIIGGVSRDKGLPGGLHVIDNQGHARPGWPVLTGESFMGGVALSDLNGDGKFEIVVASWDDDIVHVVGSDGFELPGWPTQPQFNASVRSIPVIGDVDGDGIPDVVLPSPGSWLQVVLGGDTARAGGVRAWRVDGSQIDFHPLAPMDGLGMETALGASWNRMPPAVLTDLDGDGRLDIVAASVQDAAYSPDPPIARMKMRSSVYAWELPVPAPPTNAPWAAFQGGPGRSGRLVRSVPPNQLPRVVGIPPQTVAPGDVFRAIPLDLYVEDGDDRADRLQWLVRGGRDVRVTIDAARVARVEVVTPGWVGRDSVEFVVRDPKGGEATATVGFEVRVGYRPPFAATDEVRVIEDTRVELSPLANDVSPTGRPLRVAAVSRPGSGFTSLLPGDRVRYLPATNFFGTDHFEYTIVDDDGGRATGEVVVQVAGVNDPPLLQPDRLLIDEDTTGELMLLGNDEDPDGDALALVSLQQPEFGVLESLGADRYRFTPPTNYNGLQTLTYVVRDAWGVTATGEVGILVKPVNDPPVVRDQVVVLNRNKSTDVLYDAVDPDGDKVTFVVVDAPTNGVLFSYPELANYTPRHGFSGTDRFTYRVSDGLESVGPVVVTLVIQPRNNVPEAVGKSMVTAQGQRVEVPLEASDPDLDPVVLRIVRLPGHGRVALDGTNAVYTPDPAFVGDDSFTFVGGDGDGEGAPAAVVVHVTDVNTAPVAMAEVLTVGRNQASPVELHARDGENNPLHFTVVSNTVYGRLEGEPPHLRYTPRANFRGIDRLQFQVADGQLSSGVAFVHLIVRDPNHLPVTTNQSVVLSRDTAVMVRLRATDEDGQALRAVILKGPGSGRLHGRGLDYTYVPKPGFVGGDKFTYRVWDGLGYSADATVTLEVGSGAVPAPSLSGVEVRGSVVILSIVSVPGRVLRIEVSEDLTSWEGVGVVPIATGLDRWSEALEVGRVRRFYRVRMEP